MFYSGPDSYVVLSKQWSLAQILVVDRLADLFEMHRCRWLLGQLTGRQRIWPVRNCGADGFVFSLGYINRTGANAGATLPASR
jgi:hypothetical protein